ncbi:zinc ribbon domain-containing protein [Variovorax sp. E3]|uniref:zinc ribbon domain-containing protein n=1 Tax=Variovorax sp. E3 TaxID=1914993 RepID=UPI0018DCC8E9|nr:zinc ribbon domain-containing protein [Variovorax sp. E3]
MTPLSLDLILTPLPNTPVLEKCTVVSAAGYPFFTDERVTLAFGTTCVGVIVEGRALVVVPYFELAEFSLGNPAITTTGHTYPDYGLFGGLLSGASTNKEFSSSTTQPSAQTFISLVTHVGELHLFYTGLAPVFLRMALAEAFTVWRQNQPEWLEKRRNAVDAYAEREGLDEQRRTALKGRLLMPLVPVAPPPPSPSDPFSGTAMAGNSEAPVRMGVCPSCKSEIPFFCEECPKCQALFGPDSAWQVRPL